MFSSLLTERLERLGDGFRLSPSSYLILVPPGESHNQRMAHRGYSHPVRYPKFVALDFTDTKAAQPTWKVECGHPCQASGNAVQTWRRSLISR
jgi:hypothetical protein